MTIPVPVGHKKHSHRLSSFRSMLVYGCGSLATATATYYWETTRPLSQSLIHSFPEMISISQLSSNHRHTQRKANQNTSVVSAAYTTRRGVRMWWMYVMDVNHCTHFRGYIHAEDQSCPKRDLIVSAPSRTEIIRRRGVGVRHR